MKGWKDEDADFKANADFKGHGEGVKKMNAMIAVVEGWSADGVAWSGWRCAG